MKKMRLFVLLAAAAFVISSCAALNPQKNEDPYDWGIEWLKKHVLPATLFMPTLAHLNYAPADYFHAVMASGLYELQIFSDYKIEEGYTVPVHWYTIQRFHYAIKVDLLPRKTEKGKKIAKAFEESFKSTIRRTVGIINKYYLKNPIKECQLPNCPDDTVIIHFVEVKPPPADELEIYGEIRYKDFKTGRLLRLANLHYEKLKDKYFKAEYNKYNKTYVYCTVPEKILFFVQKEIFLSLRNALDRGMLKWANPRKPALFALFKTDPLYPNRPILEAAYKEWLEKHPMPEKLAKLLYSEYYYQKQEQKRKERLERERQMKLKFRPIPRTRSTL
jgi:hypothetical protein